MSSRESTSWGHHMSLRVWRVVRELQSGPSKAAPRNGAGERRIRVTPVQKEMSKERSLRRERRCRTPRSVTDPQLLMSTSTRSGQPRDRGGRWERTVGDLDEHVVREAGVAADVEDPEGVETADDRAEGRLRDVQNATGWRGRGRRTTGRASRAGGGRRCPRASGATSPRARGCRRRPRRRGRGTTGVSRARAGRGGVPRWRPW